LTKSGEFQSLFQRGQARRVGFAVSRQLTRAVDRNRVRRRLRAAYREARASAPAGVAIVMVGKQRVLDMNFSRLVEDLQGAFSTMTDAGPTAGTRR
jgi:ribonuclease P protein component